MNPLMQALRPYWNGWSQRERQAVIAAALALALLLVWAVGVRPAWRTWKEVPREREAVEAQLLQMKGLAAEAHDLGALPPVSSEQSAQALKAATDRLGSKARLQVQGDRATLTLTGVDAQPFSAWLAEVRSGARARPIDLQLSRNGSSLSGQVVVSLAGGSE